jgi:hypothetical protein
MGCFPKQSIAPFYSQVNSVYSASFVISFARDATKHSPTTTTTTMTCPVERGIFLSLFPLSGGGARFFLILFSYGGRRRSRRKPRAATATRMSVHSRRPVWSDVASCREESGVKSVLLNKAAENRSCAARM